MYKGEGKRRGSKGAGGNGAGIEGRGGARPPDICLKLPLSVCSNVVTHSGKTEGL